MGDIQQSFFKWLRNYFPDYFAGRQHRLAGLRFLFEHYIQAGRAVFLLDGLDEVQTGRQALQKAILSNESITRRIVNSFESGLEGTTAVCTYPQGKSPLNAWDMFGNIWEWCNSSSGLSVYLGGGAIVNPYGVRGAVRDRCEPDDWNYDCGFRLGGSPFALTDETLDTDVDFPHETG
jgi:hypothetical protein